MNFQKWELLSGSPGRHAECKTSEGQTALCTGKPVLPVLSFLFIAFHFLDASYLLWHCSGGMVHAWCKATEERCEGEKMPRR